MPAKFDKWKHALRRFAPVVAMLAGVFTFFWKLTLSDQYTWMDGADTVTQVLPWLQFQAVGWHRHILPLWDPRHWGGQSLIGQNQPGAAYPLNWLLFLSPLKNGRLRPEILNYYFVAIHCIGAISAYCLCRGLKRSRLASVLGGLGYAIGGYVGTTNWPQMINGAVWSPLVLLYWMKALDGKRPFAYAAIAGGILGFSLLSGHHQIPVFTALAVGLLTIVYFANHNELTHWRLVSRYAVMLLLFLGFAGLISAVQTLPGAEYWKDALRWVNAKDPVTWKDTVPYVVHEKFSLNPVGILGTVIPYLRPAGASAYIGITVLSLAILGAISQWKLLHVRAMTYLAVGSLIYTLGAMSIFQGILYAILPMVDKARYPAMAIIGFDIAVFVLAAFGLDALRMRSDSVRKTARSITLFLLAFAGLIYAALILVHIIQGDNVYRFQGEAFAAFSALVVAMILYGWRRGGLASRSAAILLLLMMVFDQGPVTGSDYPHRENGWNNYSKLFAHDDIADYLKHQPGPFRITLDSKEVPYNFGDWHGIDQIDGYAGVSTNVIHRYAAGNAKALMGWKYYLGKAPERPDRQSMFEGASGIKVYLVPDAFPRAWIVHQVNQVEAGAMDQALSKPVSVLQSQGFMVQDPPKLESCAGPETANVVRTEGNLTAIEAELSCKGMLMISDTYAPGWVVQVDGHTTPLYETYGFIRGVVVEAGKHQVALRYRPRSVYTGALLTAFGIFCLICIALWPEFHSLSRK
jgi:hypothetical protein